MEQNHALLRYCRCGDNLALGELFDVEAPRLLRLAVHLVGDASEAEDLVQAAFLALIEARATLDPQRPIGPWLVAVVTHKARDLRRKRANKLDPERLQRQLVEDPARPLEQRELAAELASAIDQLEAPQRQVLLLRLRHGLCAADIAHVLGLSPGAVRVRISRALEKLRPLLPPSLALGLALWLTPERGLVALKSAVLAESAAKALSPSTLIVAWIMKQKVLAALAFIAVGWIGWWTWGEASVTSAETAKPAAAAESNPPPAVGSLPGTAHEQEPLLAQLQPELERRELASEKLAGELLHGQIVDAVSQLPLGGVEVALYAGQVTTQAAALDAYPELFRVSPLGELELRNGAEWPSLPVSSGPARFGKESLVLPDIPDPKSAPSASSVSAADGSFRLERALEEGVLVFRLKGFGERYLGLDRENQPGRIELWPELELSGRVLLLNGEAPPYSLDLVCVATRSAALSEHVADPRTPLVLEPKGIQLPGLCKFRTDDQGSFRIRVAGEKFHFDVLSPGWTLAAPQFVQSASKDCRVVVKAQPSFVVRRAADGEPVERLHLLAREEGSGYVVYAGEFSAPDGHLILPGNADYFENRRRGGLLFQFWAEDLGPTSLRVPDGMSVERREVWLEAGEIAAVEGFVNEAGVPLRGVEVGLLGCAAALSWDGDSEALVDADWSAGTGAFTLRAPAGKYVLRVKTGRVSALQVVELPYPGPLVMDLATGGIIALALVDEGGAPREGHLVSLIGSSGFRAHGSTDARGAFEFEQLNADDYTLFVAREPGQGATQHDRHKILLAKGERAERRLVLPRQRAERFAFVHQGDTSDYSRWRARTFSSQEWLALEPSGRIPLDLEQIPYSLELESPAGERFSLTVPEDAPDGTVLELESGKLGYRGVLVNSAGEPIADRRLWCSLWMQPTPLNLSRSVLTDVHGRFELRGLSSAPYVISICSDAGEASYDHTLQTYSFLPADLPSEEGELRLSLPPYPEPARVHGTVRHSSDNSPASDLYMRFLCKVPTPSGTFLLRCDNALTRSDANGSFELSLPRTPLHTLDIYTAWSTEGHVRTIDLVDSGLAVPPPLEILIP